MTDRELFGTTWTCQRAGTGRFRCPRCGTERGLTRTRLQRRLTVLGRPVGKLGGVAEYVTCDQCGHAYAAGAAADEALSGPYVMAEDESALLGVLAAMVLSDSAVRQAEKDACREVVRRYLGRSLPPSGVDDLLRSARRRWGDPVARLVRLRCLVPQSVKRRMVEAAYHVCAADGELHREESRLLDRIGSALDLAPREVRRALTDAKDAPLAGF